MGSVWILVAFAAGVLAGVAALRLPRLRPDCGAPSRGDAAGEAAEAREAAILAELALKSAALDSAVCGVVVTRAEDDQPILYTNRAFTKITGYTLEEVRGRNCRFLNDGFPNEEARAEIRRSIATAEPAETLLRNRRKNGEAFWNRLRHSAIRDGRGAVTHFIGVQDDVTAEIEARREAEDARDQTRAILAAAPDAILTVDRQHRITSFNRAAERLFGWSAEEIVGQDLTSLVPESYRTHHPERAAEFMTAPDDAGDGPHELTVQARRRDGSVFPAHVSLARHVQAGEPAVTVAAMDMSETVATQEKLRALSNSLAEQLQAAEAANAAKDRFLAVMSHELRTPLNGALGMTQLLASTALDARQRAFVDTILNCGRSLARIIEDVLEITRMDARAAKIAPQEVDVAQVVEEAVAAVAADMHAKGLAVERALPAGLTDRAFLSDPYRLRQALINLLANAVKFSDVSPIRIEGGLDEEGRLRLAVVDRGPGVPEAQQARIFERFTQIDDSMTRRHGGLGLGLAIAREAVALLGGEIGVESRPGEGATFWFVVPPLAGGSEDSPPAPEPQAAAPARDVVVVDDDPVSAAIIGELARRRGLRPRLYGDAEAALLERRSWASPTIFTDLHMPGLNGPEFIRRLREEPATAAAPIAIVTADARFSPDQAERLGATRCFHKPLQLETVERFLAESPAVAARPTGAS